MIGWGMDTLLDLIIESFHAKFKIVYLNVKLLIPSFLTLTFPSYSFFKNQPSPCVFSLKLHSVIDAPKSTHSGNCFEDSIVFVCHFVKLEREHANVFVLQG
jgi:hypothetical protein